MKMRLLLTLAGFAIGFIVPALAQEQNTVDPGVRQQIEAVNTKFVEAQNKGDDLALNGGWRCESGSIPFLDGLLAGS
jgi:hypothetical protein